jgi:hypothetical protein
MKYMYEVTDALHKSFSSSHNISVTDHGYSFCFSQIMYCCCPVVLIQFTMPQDMILLPHSHSAMDTM